MNTEAKLRIVCVVLGIYMVLDGFGSILVYPYQPLWPDHFIRVCRIVAGIIEVILGVLL